MKFPVDLAGLVDLFLIYEIEFGFKTLIPIHFINPNQQPANQLPETDYYNSKVAYYIHGQYDLYF